MGRHENECVPMYIHKNEHEHVIASQGTLHIVVGDKTLDAICATAGVRFDKEERLPAAFSKKWVSRVSMPSKRIVVIPRPLNFGGLLRWHVASK